MKAHCAGQMIFSCLFTRLQAYVIEKIAYAGTGSYLYGIKIRLPIVVCVGHDDIFLSIFTPYP